MDKEEAKRIIAERLGSFRKGPPSELVLMIDAEPLTEEFTAPSGNWYQIEIEAFWDDKPGGDVRVMGSIDDGGWRAFCPVSDSFIKSPSNRFVGE